MTVTYLPETLCHDFHDMLGISIIFHCGEHDHSVFSDCDCTFIAHNYVTSVCTRNREIM